MIDYNELDKLHWKLSDYLKSSNFKYYDCSGDYAFDMWRIRNLPKEAEALKARYDWR